MKKFITVILFCLLCTDAAQAWQKSWNKTQLAIPARNTQTVPICGNSTAPTGYVPINFAGTTGQPLTFTVPIGGSPTLTVLSNGYPIQFFTNGGTLPNPLSASVIYYARLNGYANNYLYDTAAHAIAGGTTGRILATTGALGSLCYTTSIGSSTSLLFQSITGDNFSLAGNYASCGNTQYVTAVQFYWSGRLATTNLSPTTINGLKVTSWSLINQNPFLTPAGNGTATQLGSSVYSGPIALGVNTITLTTPLPIVPGGFIGFTVTDPALQSSLNMVNPFVQEFYSQLYNIPESFSFTFQSGDVNDPTNGGAIPSVIYGQAPEYIAVGDSIVAGKSADWVSGAALGSVYDFCGNTLSIYKTYDPTIIAADIVPKYFGMTYQNLGWVNETTSGLAARIANITARHPSIVQVSSGINNILFGEVYPFVTMFGNDGKSGDYKIILDALTSPSSGIKLVFVTAINPINSALSGIAYNRSVFQANTLLKAYLAAYYPTVVWIDSSSILGDLTVDSVNGNSYEQKSAYHVDGAHFLGTGQQAWGNEIARQLYYNLARTAGGWQTVKW